MQTDKNALDLLDQDKIKSFITSDNFRLLTRMDVFDTISSTNTYLLECAKAQAPSGLVCFADQQTRGRGRLGRTWYSPPGANIYCSLLWRFNYRDLSGLSIAIAVILAQALQRYGLKSVDLKWPNDIWFNNRKLAGVLIESLPEHEGLIPVVIGIGLNLELPNDADKDHWIDLQEIIQQPIERNLLAGLMVDELLSQLPVFQEQGLSAFIPRWNQFDCLRDKEIIIKGQEDVCGIMRGVTDKGELLLETEDGIKKFVCGEVSVKMM